MRKIGLLVNTDKPNAQCAIGEVALAAAHHGIILLAAPKIIEAAGAKHKETWSAASIERIRQEAEAVAVLGGDGTFLRAAHQLQGADIPLMGLNIGSLGYLTGVDSTHFDDAIAALATRRYSISVRRLLSCAVRGVNGIVREIPTQALNEIIISRTSWRIVKIAVSLDGQPFATYACDGIIAATPTGSTAYSLSAGGPLIMPETRATVITAICPHSLGSRPLVVADNTLIELQPVFAQTRLNLTVDGEDCSELGVGDSVLINHSTQSVRIAFLPEFSDCRILRQKLGWAGGSN